MELAEEKQEEEAKKKESNPYKNRVLKKLLRQFTQNYQFAFCSFVILFYLLIAVLGYLNFLPDFQQRVGGSYESPSWAFAKIFGTDIFGRSVLYKILAGTKTAVTMGFVVTGVAVPIGVFLGAISGYYGKTVDVLITWLYSVIASIPGILLLIAISYSLGKGLFAVCVAMAASYWISLCRMIRGEFIKHKENEYVLAAKLLGASNFFIIFRHILPNVFHIAIVTSSLMVLNAIKAEVMLTYLGVGIQDGASWGSMITAAPGELTNEIWWSLAAVVFFMFLIIYALNVVGDSLRDILDPKLLG